jgi:hypothetical protein
MIINNKLRERINNSVHGKEKVFSEIMKIYEHDRQNPSTRSPDGWECQIEMLIRMLDFVHEMLSTYENALIVAFSHYNPIEQLLSFLAGYQFDKIGQTGITISETSRHEISFIPENEQKYQSIINQIVNFVPNVCDMLCDTSSDSHIPTQKLCQQDSKLVWVLGSYTYSMWWITMSKESKHKFCAGLAFVSSKYNVVITGYFEEIEGNDFKYVLIVGQLRRSGLPIQQKEDAEIVISFLKREFNDIFIEECDNTSNNVCQAVSGLDGDRMYTLKEASEIYDLPHSSGIIYSFNPSYANVDMGNFGHYRENAIINRMIVTNDNEIRSFVNATCNGAITTRQIRIAIELRGRIMNIEFIYL